MTGAPIPSLVVGMRRFARTGGAIVVVLGCLVLIGWAADLPVLRGVVPGFKSMNPASALAFVLAGASVWVHCSQQSASPGTPRLRAFASACAAVVLLVSAGSAS